MNWYKIFYWISVAEKIQQAIFTLAVICTVLCIVCSIIWTIARFSYVENLGSGYNRETNLGRNSSYMKFAKRGVRYCIPFFIILWFAYIAIPSKSDAILIVAGGAVGNFVTSDSSTRQIPSEITNLLKEKIQAWRLETLAPSQLSDTLKSKTKEELIELLKKKQE